VLLNDTKAMLGWATAMPAGAHLPRLLLAAPLLRIRDTSFATLGFSATLRALTGILARQSSTAGALCAAAYASAIPAPARRHHCNTCKGSNIRNTVQGCRMLASWQHNSTGAADQEIKLHQQFTA
jgi:hypothetical protein